MTKNENISEIVQNISVNFGKTTTVDLGQILPGDYTVLTKSLKGKIEIIGNTLKYTSFTWLMEKDGMGFIDGVHNDVVKIAVDNGGESATITLHVTINKLEDLFYDENGNWITDVDLMFTEEYLESVKADMKNNPKGERARIFDFMLSRVDGILNENPLAYAGRPYNIAVEYDTDLRYVADVTVNFLMAYLLTKDLPGYEAKNEKYLEKTIEYAKAALEYPYWGMRPVSHRNSDLPAGPSCSPLPWSTTG